MEDAAMGGAIVMGLIGVVFAILLVVSPLLIWSHARAINAKVGKLQKAFDFLNTKMLPELKRSMDNQSAALRAASVAATAPPVPIAPRYKPPKAAELADCPACGKEITVDVDSGGEGRCPHCGTEYRFAAGRGA